MPAVSEELIARLVVTGIAAWQSGFRTAGGAVSGLDAEIDRANSRLAFFRTTGLAAGAAAAALGAGIVKSVEAAGQIQQVEVGFKTMLGSAEAARAKIAELQKFAERTPFTFPEVAKGAQSLMGMGASAGQVIPIMTALGNAVSASGRGTAEFGRATLAVSQIISKGKLQGDELLQLAEAGVPLKEVLKELGVSMGEVGSKGITAEQAVNALIKVLTRGKFAGAMEEQSKTLVGAWSNLEDATGRLAASFGQPLVGPVTKATQFITDLIDRVNKAPPAVRYFGLAVGGIAVAALGAYSFASTIATIATTVYIKKLYDLARAHDAAALAAGKNAFAQGAAGTATGVAAGAGTATGFTSVANTAAAAGGGAAAAKTGLLARLAPLAVPAIATAGVALIAEGMRELREKHISWRDIIGATFLHQRPRSMFGPGGAAAAPGEAKPAGDPDTKKLLEEQNEILKQIRDGGGLPFSTKDIPGRSQALAFANMVR